MGKSSKKEKKKKRDKERRSRSRSSSRSPSRSPSRSRDRSRDRSRSSRSSHKREKKEKRDKSRDRSREKSRRRERERSRSESRGRDRKLSRKEEKRRKEREKEALKAKETPEERRARRLEKKQRKREKREANQTLHGYTNDENPFNDNNLTQVFVWKKKYEKEIASGKDPRELTKEALRKQQEEHRREIELVKERREKRERENEEMQQMRDFMERQANIDMDDEWEEKEEEFHREQETLRSKIRIESGRERPIDMLMKNLIFEKKREEIDEERMTKEYIQELKDERLRTLDIVLTEPYKVFDGLSTTDLEELEEEIRARLEFGEHTLYWEALATLCANELKESRALDALYQSEGRSEVRKDDGIHEALREEILSTLKDKTKGELEELEKEIQAKIETATSAGRERERESDVEKEKSREREIAVDVEFNESILAQISVFKARVFLHEFHLSVLEKRLAELREFHLESIGVEQLHRPSLSLSSLPPPSSSSSSSSSISVSLNETNIKREREDMDIESSSSMSFEPPLLSFDEVSTFLSSVIDDYPDVDVVEAEEEEESLETQRLEVLLARKREIELLKNGTNEPQESSEAVSSSASTSSSLRFDKRSSEAVGEGEDEFSLEADVSDTSYWWHDKYRPRRPRFFNRVKTGFDWNKYNRVHYDKENPPPKVVQGYKFNIFYPDLIEKTPPTYTLTPDPNNSDYATIRFSAGAPYEDIAFRIVNKQWDHRRGFKYQFNRGVLHLYFNFKRYFWRK